MSYRGAIWYVVSIWLAMSGLSLCALDISTKSPSTFESVMKKMSMLDTAQRKGIAQEISEQSSANQHAIVQKLTQANAQEIGAVLERAPMLFNRVPSLAKNLTSPERVQRMMELMPTVWHKLAPMPSEQLAKVQQMWISLSASHKAVKHIIEELNRLSDAQRAAVYALYRQWHALNAEQKAAIEYQMWLDALQGIKKTQALISEKHIAEQKRLKQLSDAQRAAIERFQIAIAALSKEEKDVLTSIKGAMSSHHASSSSAVVSFLDLIWRLNTEQQAQIMREQSQAVALSKQQKEVITALSHWSARDLDALEKAIRHFTTASDEALSKAHDVLRIMLKADAELQPLAKGVEDVYQARQAAIKKHEIYQQGVGPADDDDDTDNDQPGASEPQVVNKPDKPVKDPSKKTIKERQQELEDAKKKREEEKRQWKEDADKAQSGSIPLPTVTDEQKKKFEEMQKKQKAKEDAEEDAEGNEWKD